MAAIIGDAYRGGQRIIGGGRATWPGTPSGHSTAAMAGPATSLRLRTQALHQALDRRGPLGNAIGIDASWNVFTNGFTGQPVLNEDDFSAATSTLASGLAASVPLAPGSWAGLTTNLHAVQSGTGPLPVGYHPRRGVKADWRQAAAVLAVALAGPPLIALWRRRGGVAGYVGLAGALERRTATALPMALPAVLAAFAAAAGCALARPAVIGPALDLSVFTDAGATVSYRPDLAALALPAGLILALIAAALTAQTTRSRRRGVTGLLRT